METKIVSWGRIGRFEIEKKTLFFRHAFSIEPWSGLYYMFHGACLPLLFERIVDEYRSHRVRALIWDKERVSTLWNKTSHLWFPVIDWVNEKDFAYFIGFRFHPYQIEWYWNMQCGDSKELSKERVAGLQERFEDLGNGLRKILAAD